MPPRPAVRALALQFTRFGIVGFAAFCVTTGLIYAARGTLGPAIAGAPAYLLGISTGWMLNRNWTFKHRSTEGLFVQWLRYAIWTGPSILVNAAVYEASVLTSPFVHAHPIVGTAAGAIVGMLVSFVVVRWVVFKPRPDAVSGDTGAG